MPYVTACLDTNVWFKVFGCISPRIKSNRNIVIPWSASISVIYKIRLFLKVSLHVTYSEEALKQLVVTQSFYGRQRLITVSINFVLDRLMSDTYFSELFTCHL